MPLIIDDSNWQTQIGDGRTVTVAGEKFLLSAMPKPEGHDSRAYSKPFSAEVPTIPRSEWSARIKEQKERKRRISDHQNWPCDAQSGPTCWAAGTCQAGSTARVIQLGLKHYVRFSAMSIAVPISGGRSGGYEGDAVSYMTKYGAVDSKLWGYGSIRPTASEAELEASRKRHMALETYECEGFDEFATACLLNFPSTVSYNWWRHVVMLTDLVEIEPGSFGFLIRNNWGDSYGDKNEYGHGGYAIFREGRGTPSGGFAFRQVTPSLESAA
jgi:hypothetical protein